MTGVTVIGLDGGPLRQDALAALSRAALVIGWPEHVSAVRALLPPRAEVREIDRDLPATVRALSETDEERVVLTSGDPGYFGVVPAIRAAHDDLAVIPAVSSVTAAFAAAGLSWEDAHLVSAHREPPHRALAVCRRFAKVAVLTDRGFGPAQIGAALVGLPKRLVVAERMGLRGQRVSDVGPEEAAARTWEDPNVVLVLDAGAPGPSAGAPRTWSTPPRWTSAGWALPHDTDSQSRGALRPAVSALVLAWLGPGLGDLVWTVGDLGLAGEVARLGAASFAVVDEPEATGQAAAGDVPVALVHGRAPVVLASLPDPDGVAIVGGDHLLTETVRTAADRARRAVVVVLADAGRVEPVDRALHDAGFDVARTQLGVAPVERDGGPADVDADAVVVVAGWRP